MDADNDIVVGDTIIFTERLYMNRDGDLLQQGHGPASTPVAPPPSIATCHHHGNPSPGGGSGPQISLSVASLGSGGAAGEGRWASSVGAPFRDGNSNGNELCGGIGIRRGTPGSSVVTAGGDFVGERTVAAHVLQDSFRLMRRREGAVLEYNR